MTNIQHIIVKWMALLVQFLIMLLTGKTCHALMIIPKPPHLWVIPQLKNTGISGFDTFKRVVCLENNNTKDGYISNIFVLLQFGSCKD